MGQYSTLNNSWAIGAAGAFAPINLEGEEKKSLQDILLSTAKVINLRVKSQARGQNNRSIALK